MAWSSTYVLPDFDPPPGWPESRAPGATIRLVPNESIFTGDLQKRLGDLTQALIEAGADYGVAVEIDTSDRTRPGELRSGSSPIEGIALLVLAGAAGAAGRQIDGLVERAFDAAIGWALRWRHKEAGAIDDPISVAIYGPDGKVLKRVYVPQGQGDAPPYERADRDGLGESATSPDE
jgi:hypothetical protein